MTDRTLLILPGDGIGPEVMTEVRKVIDWFGTQGIGFDVSEDLVGGAAYDAHGTPLTDATMARAQEVDAVLLGAVGGPEYDALDFSVKPERGLLRLRKEMDLYANLRPAQCFDALADFSSLKTEVVAGLDHGDTLVFEALAREKPHVEIIVGDKNPRCGRHGRAATTSFVGAGCQGAVFVAF